ncbi:uncharacterized protein LOC113281251 [Papaver somniferum]|uniref:uncharacterized protein LOC113281251 n=1 Tax=Papaver somniferum TaxID=3469 RepID=UPI000E70540A|nr:uncharacterized protein LOC113281251 [Papaver somniferum]
MEVHSSSRNSVIGKRLWRFLRIAYYMMRKGFMSKRKLLMDMNLMMKRGKLMRKSLGNLMTFHSHHHHHNSHDLTRGSFGNPQDYEFSCSNSPNPVFSHMSKRKHHYFPCINPPNEEDLDEEEIEEEEAKAVVVVRPKVGYSPECAFSFQFSTAATPDLAPGDSRFSPLLSPFAVRVTEYSSEEENEIQLEGMRSNPEVDDEAEDFIKRFYEQLRLQSKTQLLQYQENQYQEMLARGTC